MIYTIKEVAEILKVNPETIKRMIYSKKIKAFKVARNWRIAEEEIERLKRGE